MLAFALVALITQPLDAVYSTAGHPNNCGLAVTLRYPSGWRAVPLSAPYAVGEFAGEWSRVVIHIQADAAMIQDAETDYTRDRVYRDLLFREGTGNSYVPPFATVAGVYEVTGPNDNPIRAIEHFGDDGRAAHREMVYACFFDHKLVVVRLGCGAPTGSQSLADERFNAMRPIFTDIYNSLSMSLDRAKGSRAARTMAIAVSAFVMVAFVAFIAHRRFTSSVCASQSQGPADRRLHRR